MQHITTSLRKRLNLLGSYHSKYCFVQQELAKNILERLEYTKSTPEYILEIGFNRSSTKGLLNKAFPQASVISLDLAEDLLSADGLTVCATLLNIPFNNDCFDVVLLNTGLEFFSVDLQQIIFYQCQRVLKKQGLFVFSALGPDTLQEIVHAELVDMHILGDLLLTVGFQDPVVENAYLTIDYATTENTNIRKDIKYSGASIMLNPQSFKKKDYQTILKNMQNTTTVTLECIYGYAKKSSLPNLSSRDSNGLLQISADLPML